MTQTHINIAMLAHVDAGKTTLSEALLYKSGSIRKAGRVDNKDAFLDTNEMERNRGITIFSKQAVFSYGGCEFTLLDTPGHVDFSAEMERTLQVLDYAVLIISGLQYPGIYFCQQNGSAGNRPRQIIGTDQRYIGQCLCGFFKKYRWNISG